jgi:hypothetical protein
VVERRRDEPEMDATVGMLERALGLATKAIDAPVENALGSERPQ